MLKSNQAKFRGYSKILHRWIYGTISYGSEEGSRTVSITGTYKADKDVCVDPESVSQRVLLNEGNNQEYYVGDIVETKDGVRGTIVFDWESLSYKLRMISSMTPLDRSLLMSLKVVGNSYDFYRKFNK